MVSKFKFSTKNSGGIHPVDAMRSVMGKVDIVFPKEEVPEVSLEGMNLGAISINDCTSTVVRMSRRARNFNRDEINIVFCEKGGANFAAGKGSEDVSVGEVILRDTTVDGVAQSFGGARWKTLVIPKISLAHLIDVNRIRTLEKLQANDPAARLLHYYANAIQQDGGLDVSPFQSLVSGHILELTALILGGDADLRAEAESSSMPSVRKHAAISFIRARLGNAELSDMDVAAHLNVSPSYVRKLFVADGGLQNYIMSERLALAHQLLASEAGRQAKVIGVAFQCGFSSLYTFNRQFKRRYGYTPSDAREILDS